MSDNEVDKPLKAADFKEISKVLPDTIFLTDSKGVVREIYPGKDEKVLANGGEGLKGEHIELFIPEEQRPELRDKLDVLKEDGKQFSFYFQSGPEKTYFETRFAPLEENEIAVFVRESETLISMEGRFREREELFQTLLNNVPIIMYATDAQGKITMIDGKGLTDMGVFSRDMVGRNFFDIAAHIPLFVENLRQALGGEEFSSIIEGEQGRIYENYFSPIRNPEGQVAGVMGIATDITVRENLEEQLRQSQKMEVAGRLAGGVAHDFNNLLTIIMLNTERLLETIPVGDSEYSFLQIIDGAASRAAEITNRLLTFSRKQMLQPQVIQLNSLVHDLQGMVNQLLGEKIELVLDIADDVHGIRADAGQMEQIILNLAVNARDAMPKGGIFSVEVRNMRLSANYAQNKLEVSPGDYVLLAVKDTGHGMPRDVLEHIFEPFFTTKETGKGTGLGLSTVYGIVKQFKGHIEVITRVNEGTEFQLFFSRVFETPEKKEEKKPAPQEYSGEETILLVEDDDDVRESIRLILQRNKYKILEARQGEDALVVCELYDSEIHLLMTDVVLPGISGGELAKLAVESRPKMKVLYISGYPDNAIEEYGVTPGSLLMQKPFKPAQLMQKVREIFDTADRKE